MATFACWNRPTTASVIAWSASSSGPAPASASGSMLKRRAEHVLERMRARRVQPVEALGAVVRGVEAPEPRHLVEPAVRPVREQLDHHPRRAEAARRAASRSARARRRSARRSSRRRRRRPSPPPAASAPPRPRWWAGRARPRADRRARGSTRGGRAATRSSHATQTMLASSTSGRITLTATPLRERHDRHAERDGERRGHHRVARGASPPVAAARAPAPRLRWKS